MTSETWNPSDEVLNAYVDGELPSHEAAMLLRQMARNPELAERVAILTRLRMELRDLPLPRGLDINDLETLAAGVPPARPGARGGEDALAGRGRESAGVTGSRAGIGPAGWAVRWPARWPGRAVSAAAVVLLLVAIPFGMTRYRTAYSDAVSTRPQDPSPADQVAPSGTIEAAVARHMEWLAQPATTTGPGRGPTLARFARRHGRVYVPDLGASKLQMVRTEPFGKDGVRVGYVGIHDCRLSLFILPDTLGAPVPMREITMGKARVFAWRANQLDYLLVAAGMDRTRLNLISKAVYGATRNLQPFAPATQLALDLNHRNSRACVSG